MTCGTFLDVDVVDVVDTFFDVDADDDFGVDADADVDVDADADADDDFDAEAVEDFFRMDLIGLLAFGWKF